MIHNFCSEANYADGNLPSGLVLGQDGRIYGTTQSGGTAGDGTIFRFDTATSSFATVFTFGSSTGGFPSHLTLASDGNFYGLTAGNNVNANIFRFVPGGSGAPMAGSTAPPPEAARSRAAVKRLRMVRFGVWMRDCLCQRRPLQS